MNPQASALNDVLVAQNPEIYSLLSHRGREIFFPKKGLVMQGQDANGKRINASIGMATEDDGSPLRLSAIESLVNLPPEKSVSLRLQLWTSPFEKKLADHHQEEKSFTG